ncbi:MAG: Protein often near L-alanine-DL-glutamate epimerase (cell wall recycling) [uncultured Sphingomonadaceae bacterium]|uniref:Protein often near L-alanine-DL-glutamate epimerase (Cell wall recycling) n=1 Tax=uncultured Sphingomonadaceae bacterium TaxID=169976 RepID=A0A6J4TT19_9SPHN|nr:MAG: Protein often near L-alanine-DL-glutamate epimerase (cell wall recycling) [uncultured Sphingomonadaceae bacterium]
MIPSPFLLYLGLSADALGIKTSRGLAEFRREDCVGEFRHDDCPQTLGLPRLTMDEAVARGARTLVLGIAGAGGKLPRELVEDAATALRAGMNVAAGLHERLRDQAQLARLASERGLQLFDVRDPPPNLSVGKGYPRAGRRLLTVGTDCSVGKMYATLALTRALREQGIAADFRATGQTGILIAGAGVPVDAVVADFIAGAIEQLAPAREDGGWDLIEGQGSLFHPSFAGVSLGLLHGSQPEALVLCHEPGRTHMRGIPGRALPDLAECLERNLEAARLTSTNVRAVGICLNTSAMERDAALRLCALTEDRLGLPCTDPIAFGVNTILDRLLCPEPSALSTTASN